MVLGQETREFNQSHPVLGVGKTHCRREAQETMYLTRAKLLSRAAISGPSHTEQSEYAKMEANAGQYPRMVTTLRLSSQRDRKKSVTEGIVGCDRSTPRPWHQKYYFFQRVF